MTWLSEIFPIIIEDLSENGVKWGGLWCTLLLRILAKKWCFLAFFSVFDPK